MISVSRAPTVAHADLLLEGSCNFRPCFPRAGHHCDRPCLGPPGLALYSLTESARTPFHAEPAQVKVRAPEEAAQTSVRPH